MTAALPEPEPRRRPTGGGAVAALAPLEVAAGPHDVPGTARRSRRIGSLQWSVGLIGAAIGALGAALALARGAAPIAGGDPGTRAALESADIAREVAEIRAALAQVKFSGPLGDDGAARGPGQQRAQHRAAAARVVALTERWRAVAPADPALVPWLDRRWSLFVHQLDRAADVEADTASAAASADASLARVAALARAEAAVAMLAPDAEARVAAAEAAGADPTRIALAWCKLGSRVATTPADQRRYLARAAALPADSRHLEVPMQRLSERLAAVGGSLELRFDDVRSGRPFDLAAIRGAPVLILAWSGNSAAVSAAIEAARRLARELGPAGLVVVGAHEWRLDGGAPALAARLAELDFDVPHLYEEPATPWEGQVRALGVREVPCAILVDRAGRVVMSSARVEALEALTRAECAARGGAGMCPAPPEGPLTGGR